MFHKILKQVKQPTTLEPIILPKLEQIKEQIIEEEKTNEQPQKPIKKQIKPVFRT